MRIDASTGLHNQLMWSKKDEDEKNEQLASGKRITSAAIDPAGLQIANRISSDIQANQAYNNIYQNTISMNNIESAQLQANTEALQANQALAVQAGNGIYNGDDLAALQAQADANTATISNAAELGVSGLNISDSSSIDSLQSAQQSVDQEAAYLGAASNVAQSQIRSTQVAIEAQSAARSRVLDGDYAKLSSQKAQNDVALLSATLLGAQADKIKAKTIEQLT